PSNMRTSLRNFIAGASNVKNYWTFGPTGNDGSVVALVSATTAGQVGIATAGASGQTADLLQMKKSDGTIYSKFNAIGELTAPFVTVASATNAEAPLRITSNSNGSFPTATAQSGSIGNNFSGAASEVNFWNDATAATTAFDFNQLTGASSRRQLLRI